jgi:CO/xanthine dehydrogenase FAD-binding subunit
MKEALFFAAANVKEALKLLGQYKNRAVILAGGTDLAPQINTYAIKPEVLIYIGNSGLDYIKEARGKILIGAGTKMAGIANSKLLSRKVPALAEAARQAGTQAVRSTATIGGNLVNASPAADLATPLLALDAEMTLTKAGGKRTVALKDFFTGPGKTVLKPGELMTEISIPAAKGKTVFLKLGKRKAMTLSVVNVAVRVDVKRGKCEDARIALGSMAPIPLRCEDAEEMLQGKAVDLDLISQCAAEAIGASKPIDDQRASAWYRRQAGKALVARALTQAAGLKSE